MMPIRVLAGGRIHFVLTCVKAARCTNLVVLLVVAVTTLSGVAKASCSWAQRAVSGYARAARNAELREAALTSPEPSYPPLAKAARVTGVVEVEIGIGPSGDVLSARAISGHPLLKDSAVAAARQWKFDAVKLSALSGDSLRTLVFVFELEQESGNQKPIERSSAKSDLRVYQLQKLCRAEIARPAPNNERLSLWLAQLAVSVAEDDLSEALRLFDDAKSQGKLPIDAKPYYARLVFRKYLDESGQIASGEDNGPLEGALSQALELFIESYNDELAKGASDPRKLADIGRSISHIYKEQGKSDAYCDSLASVLRVPDLSDSLRAIVSYELGVQYWSLAYAATSPFVSKNEPVPDDIVSTVRPWIAEGYSCIQTTQNLDPTYANAWFYEKLIALQEFYTESDLDRKKLLQRRVLEAQDHYGNLMKQKAHPKYLDNDETQYSSGLPSLMMMPFVAIPPPAPPPPPPPPPALR